MSVFLAKQHIVLKSEVLSDYWQWRFFFGVQHLNQTVQIDIREGERLF